MTSENYTTMHPEDDEDDEAFLPPGFLTPSSSESPEIPVADFLLSDPNEAWDFLNPTEHEHILRQLDDENVDLLQLDHTVSGKENCPVDDNCEMWKNCDAADQQWLDSPPQNLRQEDAANEEEEKKSTEGTASKDEELNLKLDELAADFRAEVVAGNLLMDAIASPTAAAASTGFGFGAELATEDPQTVEHARINKLEAENAQLAASLQEAQDQILQLSTENEQAFAQQTMHAEQLVAEKSQLATDLLQAEARMEQLSSEKDEVITHQAQLIEQLHAEKHQLVTQQTESAATDARHVEQLQDEKTQLKEESVQLAAALLNAEARILQISTERDESITEQTQLNERLNQAKSVIQELNAQKTLLVEQQKAQNIQIATGLQLAEQFEQLNTEKAQLASDLERAEARIQLVSLQRDEAVSQQAQTSLEAEKAQLATELEHAKLLVLTAEQAIGEQEKLIEQLNADKVWYEANFQLAEARAEQVSAERNASNVEKTQLIADLHQAVLLATSEKETIAEHADRQLHELRMHYESEIDRLQQEMESAVVESSRVASEVIEASRKKVNDLHVAMADQEVDTTTRDKQKIRNLQRRVGALASELKDKKLALEASVETEKKCTTKIKHLQRRIGALLAAQDASVESVTQGNEQINSLQLQVGALESALNEATRTKDALRKIRSLQRHVGALNSDWKEREADLAAKDGDMNDTNTESQKKIRSLQRQIGSLESELQTVSKAREALATRFVPSLQRRIGALESHLLESEVEKEAINASLFEVTREKEQKLRSLQRQIGALESNLREHKVEKVAMLAATEAADGEKDQKIRSLQRRIGSLESDINANQTALKALEASTDEAQQETICCLQRIGVLELTLKEIQVTLEETKQDEGTNQSLQTRIAELDAALKSNCEVSSKEVKQDRGTIRRLQRRVGALSLKESEAELEAKQKEGKIRHLWRRVGALQSELQAMYAERAQLVDKLEECAERLILKEQENSQTQELHRQAKLEAHELEAEHIIELDSLRDEIKEIAAVNRTAVEEHGILIAQHEEKVSNLQASVAKSENAASAALMDAEGKFSCLLELVTRERDEAISRVADAESGIQSIRAEIESSKEQFQLQTQRQKEEILSLQSLLEQLENLKAEEREIMKEESLIERVDFFTQCYEYFQKQRDVALSAVQDEHVAVVEEMKDAHLAEMVSLFRKTRSSATNPGSDVVDSLSLQQDKNRESVHVAHQFRRDRDSTLQEVHQAPNTLKVQPMTPFKTNLIMIDVAGDHNPNSVRSPPILPSGDNHILEVALVGLEALTLLQSPTSAFVSYINKEADAETTEEEFQTHRKNSATSPLVVTSSARSDQVTSLTCESTGMIPTKPTEEGASLCHPVDHVTRRGMAEPTAADHSPTEPFDNASIKIVSVPIALSPQQRNHSTMTPSLCRATPKTCLDFSTPSRGSRPLSGTDAMSTGADHQFSAYRKPLPSATPSTGQVKLLQTTPKISAAKAKLRSIESTRLTLKPPASSDAVQPMPSKLQLSSTVKLTCSGLPRCNSKKAEVTKRAVRCLKEPTRRSGLSVPSSRSIAKPGGTIPAVVRKVQAVRATRPSTPSRLEEKRVDNVSTTATTYGATKLSSRAKPSTNEKKTHSSMNSGFQKPTVERKKAIAKVPSSGLIRPSDRTSLMGKKPKSRLPQLGSDRTTSFRKSALAIPAADPTPSSTTNLDILGTSTKSERNDMFQKMAELRASSSTPLLSRSSRCDILLSAQKSTSKKAEKSQGDLPSSLVLDLSSTRMKRESCSLTFKSPALPLKRPKTDFTHSHFTPLKVGHEFLDLLSPASPLVTPLTVRNHKSAFDLNHMSLAATRIQSAFRSYRAHHRANKEHAFNLLQRHCREAAVIVQKTWRGSQRRQVASKRRKRKLVDASVTIQKYWRAMIGMKRHRKLVSERHENALTESAAVSIQKVTRGFTDRLTVKRRREQMTKAAVFIQSIWRAFRESRRFNAQREAASTIQSCGRGFLMQLKSENLQKVIRAAVRIQSYQRMSRHQRQYLSMRLTVIAVQAIVRRKMSRTRMQRRLSLVAASSRIQCFWRMVSCRCKYRTTLRHIVSMQAVSRGWMACRRQQTVKNESAAAVIMQSNWREHVVRTKYLATLRAIIAVQAVSRVLLARRRYVLKQKATVEKSAAVCIQSSWRRAHSRRRYLATCQLARLTQSYFRGVLARRKAILNSALLVQAFWRMIHCRNERFRSKQSATCIQARMRGVIQRTRSEQQKMSAQCIQMMWRMTAYRREYKSTLRLLVVIQAFWRGSVTRFRASKQQVKSSSAALRIQTWWRTHACSREYTMTFHAIRTIQCFAWRVIAKYKLKQQRHEAVSAALIQSLWRMKQCQQGFLRATRAIVALQALYRGTTVRKLASRQRAMVKSAVSIQSNWRMTKNCNHYRSFLVSARLIQTMIRFAIVRRRASDQIRNRHAAVRIQSFVRMIGIHDEYESLYRATMILQARARKNAAKRLAAMDLRELVHAVIIVQKNWRKSNFQRQFALAQNAVLRIQFFSRSVLARRKTREQAAIREASTRIQTNWRASRDRRKFRAVIVLQAFARGYIARSRADSAKNVKGISFPRSELPDTETPLKPELPEKGNEVFGTIASTQRNVFGDLTELTSKKSTRKSRRKPLGAAAGAPFVLSPSKAKRTTRTKKTAVGDENRMNTPNFKMPTNTPKTRASVTAKIHPTRDLVNSVASISDDDEQNTAVKKEVEKLKVVDLRQELKSYGLASNVYNKLRKAELVTMVVEKRASRSMMYAH